MNERVFIVLLALIAAAFSMFFAVTVLPALAADGDIMAAILGGFVNPFAAGYSTDVILCWVVLAIWVAYERKTLGIRNGWICVVLGAVPGVAVGFALYLILRSRRHREPAPG